LAASRLAKTRADTADLLVITVQHLPEGVYLATSEDLPGLIVETKTREDAIIEAQQVAFDLLDLAGKGKRRNRRLAFVFND
jgi:predicted RNase H-like HicB family nuclease